MGIPGGARILIRYENSKGVWDFQQLIGIPRIVPKSHWGSGALVPLKVEIASIELNLHTIPGWSGSVQ